MCLILYAINVHPNYKLLIAANRDEFYNRPSTPAHFWDDSPTLLAGKDQIAGGTWMGITRGGRIATLTNFRDPSTFKSKAISRGQLVSGYLQGKESVYYFIQNITKRINEYNGFNLVLGDYRSLYYYSSRKENIQKFSNGIFGLSNNLLDIPWPKVIRGKVALKQIISEDKEIVPEDIFQILNDRTVADDGALPDTGVGLEMERMLSPIFIRSPDYGTRSSTLILVDRLNSVTFMERTYKPENDLHSDVTYQFQITS